EVVAVVDSGIRAEHPDLQGQTVPGFDFVDGDADPHDENGHGTAVAGVIAARSDSVGITGVAPGTRIMPVRVLDKDGSGTSAAIAEGIDWAADHGARIVNLSLGGPGRSQVLAEAIARHPDVLFVAAAGNGSDDVDTATGSPQYPCALTSPNIICVAATD